MTRAAGFTLIELLIALAVVAILATIALPAYTDYLVRGKLVEAVSGLADWRVKMEQYYQDNRNYGTSATDCPAAAAVPRPASKYFGFSCSWAPDNTKQSFQLTATSLTGQGLGAAGDFVYTLDHGNRKTTLTFYGQTRNAPCWLAKKGDSC